ncbi:hypothetical protein J4558_07380 [Leptolyngbya sp. 15MV]|nr:hypothetical protein J4558_07380 [Leptolyngbya sp. 15MV]
MKTVVGPCALLLLVAGSAVARPPTPQPEPQFFNRSANWTGLGTNPSQVNGQPIWYYEYTSSPLGGPLGSALPWYTLPRSLMVWDENWFSTGHSVFARGDDLNPPIFQNRLVHNVLATEHQYVPVVRWQNPASNANPLLALSGNLIVGWDGPNGIGNPNTVDVIVAKIDALLGTMTVLLSETVTKPTNQPSAGETRTIPVSISGVPLQPGDSVIITHRARTSSTPFGSWVFVRDELTIATVPAPATLGVLAMAGLAMGRRRR